MEPKHTTEVGKQTTIQLMTLGKLVTNIGKKGPYPHTTKKSFMKIKDKL